MKIDFISDINKGYEDSLNYKRIDGFIVKVLWWHFGIFALVAFLNAGLKIASYYPSPLAWRVITPAEAFTALVIAIFVTLLPALFRGGIENHYLWRLMVTAALTVYSYLFVFISGGSIEMHFHFFMAAALIVVYADWRLGWLLLVMAGLHHGILNYVEPGWVYYYGKNDLAVLAHAVPVLVMAIFTTVLCAIVRQSVIELRTVQGGLESGTKELEKLKSSLEDAVKKRTGELSDKVSELERVNRLMIDREAKMIELKKEITALKTEK